MTGNAEQGYMSVEDLIRRIRKYHPEDDMDLVRRAYQYAEKAHENQKRKSGEPYFSHPCAVAVILTDLMLDATTIAAGLLHDCVEDVDGVTQETIRQEFGQEVELLVDGVTKLSQLNFASREEAQAETLRKMFLAMAKDIRVVLIKLADRLHNMRTLKYQKPERQIPIARETLDIYAPLAHRMGVYTIKWELEDLSLRYIDPEGYQELVRLVGMKREERERLIADVSQQLGVRLREAGIKAEITGRPKHFYSIYKKMKSQNKTFDQINDLIALRVLVNTQQDCYFVLGVVHTMWPQVPGRFKDYISMPKANMYQSLHTTVVNQGKPFEVQIRTFEMHRTAEYGIAAHWRYKEGRANENELDQKLSWLRRILDWQSDVRDPGEFGELAKVDLFADEVFVFTPKGDVISLPRGATPLDFAYRIHSAVGNRCIGAKVNGRIVPLAAQLETGDFVEVMTSANSHGPSRDWLNIVKTSEAKAKIRAWLKKEQRDVNIPLGKDMLDKEAKRLGYSMSQLLKGDAPAIIEKRFSAQTLDDIYAMVGFGGLSCAQVVNRLVDEYKKNNKAEEAAAAAAAVLKEEPQRKQPQSSSNGVIVKGESGMLVRFARCCNPLPGDRIVGYITRGRGVSVHRADCVSLKDPDVEKDRLIEVEWEAQGANASYEAEIRLITYNRTGLLAEISVMLAAQNVPVSAISGHAYKDSTYIFHVSIIIKDTAQLNRIIRELQKWPDVIEVDRVSS